MTMRRLSCVLSLLLLCAAAACSHDDSPTESQPDVANGVDGGSDSNVPDTTIADSHDAAVDSTVDSTPDSLADAVDTTVDCAHDGCGSLCPSGQWFDFEMGSCADCPETPRTLQCSDFFFPASSWDASTSTFDLQLNVSIAQMVAGSVDYKVVHPSGLADMLTATATFSGNDLRAVFTVASDAIEIDVLGVHVTDACGTSSLPGVAVTITPTTDGGPPDHADFSCPVP